MRTGLSNEVKRQIIEFRRQGFSMKETADNLKITRNQVAGVLFRAGETKKKSTETSGTGGRDIHIRS